MDLKKFNKLLIVSLLLTLIACSEKPANSTLDDNVNSGLNSIEFANTIPSTANRDKLPNTSAGGVSLGLYNDKGVIEKDFNFNYNADEKINKFISIGNFINTDRVYKIILLIDYKQAKFSVDNREPEEDFTLEVKAGESVEIPFQLPNLDRGLHDILFVIIKSPENKSFDEEYRKKTDMNHLLFLRFSTVIQEETVNEQIKYNEYGIIENNSMLDGLLVTKNNDLKRWLTQNVASHDILNYYIRVGNNSNKQLKRYAVVNLFDWKQVDVIDDRKIVYFEVSKDNLVKLNSGFTINQDSGTYDLTTLLIHNPYQKLDIYNRDVETGIRVGVKVN
ncbi:hypothetical protein [Paenibacillus rhizoplanae]|uniref:DUF4352 domain-containing protein n=2 Tax=Paenibacillus rhizoplanae TaxID=1917181 RepID=A0ABW5FH65_9BACL